LATLRVLLSAILCVRRRGVSTYEREDSSLQPCSE
jgi:hypothetical protein